MAGVKFTVDDSELRGLLANLKGAKKEYRELANDVLQDLKEDIASYTHVDTGQMKASWETSPLKMRDGGYAIFGEVYNEAQKPWHTEPYPSYEIARGGSHDAISLGVSSVENKLNGKLMDVLEGLLR
ncbi:MAG: hypothetical protein ACI3T9_03975 [Romboutsia timonensis]